MAIHVALCTEHTHTRHTPSRKITGDGHWSFHLLALRTISRDIVETFLLSCYNYIYVLQILILKNTLSVPVSQEIYLYCFKNVCFTDCVTIA